MSAPIPRSADTAPESARALAQARIGAQLQLLGDLAEIGLSIARAVERQATGGQAENQAPATTGDVTLAYERVARAVGMTVALQSKLVESLHGLQKAGAERRERADTDRRFAGYERRIHVAHITDRVAWAAYRAEQEHDAAQERLDTLRPLIQDWVGDATRAGDLMARPISETVAAICRDLGLSPDWPTLAQEAWAREEMQGGAVGAPLKGLMAEAAEPEPSALGGWAGMRASRYRSRALRRRDWSGRPEPSG
jgi:hypothetical protein